MPSSVAHELVDIVTDDDRVIATVTRGAMRANRLQHRAVFIAVVSSAGRLLVHRRSDAKDVWPGWWDIAVGGVVASGESYDDAATRELAEEIGVRDVVPDLLGSARYADDQVALVCHCYRVRHDGPFTFDDGEVVEARWASQPELGKLLREQRFLPDSLAVLLPLLSDFT